VVPDAGSVPRPRKLLYRIRVHVSRWSPAIFRLARALRCRWLYLAWARGVVALYHGLAYSRGRLGKALARFGWAQ